MKNKTKRLVKLFCTFLSGCLLTACHQAPDEVLEQMENYRNNQHIEEEVEVGYCSLEQLNKTSIGDLNYIPENLELPKNVDFTKIQNIGILKMSFKNDFLKQKEKVADYFNVQDCKWEEYNGILDGDHFLFYDNVDEKIYLDLCDNGTFSYSSGGCYELEEIGEEEIKEVNSKAERFYVGAGDVDESTTINLSGKIIMLSEQIKWVEEQLTQSDILDHNFTYSVEAVCVRHFDGGKDRLSMLAQIEYKGMALDYFGGAMTQKNNIPVVEMMDNSIVINMEEPFEIIDCDNNGQFEIDNYDKLDQIIDFNSAVQLVSNELSGFKTVKIREIKPIYTLMPQYDYKSGEIYYAKAGNEVFSRPVYSFLIEFGDDYSVKGISEENTLCYINVDMITGEVTSNLEARHYVNNAEIEEGEN